MSRFTEEREFIDYDLANSFFIEPQRRLGFLREKIIEALTLFNPQHIVKAGLGSGELLETLSKSPASITVVEPSLQAIEAFKTKYADMLTLKKIYFINGNFSEFPIDYFKADMLISIDYFDFIESSTALDEFKRALEFEGIFIFGGVILNSGDLDGVFDDFYRLLDPLHNDFYLADDLTTFMRLKEFSSVKSDSAVFRISSNDIISYWERFGKTADISKAKSFIEENRERFESLYNLADGLLDENYLFASYRRNKTE